MRPTTAIALLAALLPAIPTLAGEGAEVCRHGKLELATLADEADSRAFDAESGRDLRHFPPDRLVDYRHMSLRMRFDDLDRRRFEATEELTVAAIGNPVPALELDAVGLDIGDVRMDGRPVEYFHDGEVLTLRFQPPLAVDRQRRIVMTYACVEPTAGMVFTPSSPQAPHYTAEVHTQGQTETNRHWFVAHDHPNERMTTELIVDVPAGFAVSGNGHLVSHEVADDREVWHWLQDKPHVSYLVSMVIGRFDRVAVQHERVPMHVWVPEGTGHLVEGTYGPTAPMIDVFEERFGVPYPWDRYDQIVVKNFDAGGMENTSVTTLYPTAILDEIALADRTLEGLIAHELAHQWTGDLITCKSWAHVWLNEGWATYGEALWYEASQGWDGYLDAIRGEFRVARRDRTTNALPMVSPVYTSPWETFRRRANPYPKGASILHMLRMMLGEDVFWAGVHLYMNRHALGVVETDDLRHAFEEVSGRNLEWFFEQWCYRPGCPELKVKVGYDAGGRTLRVDVEQHQHIDARTPAFRFTLPVHVVTDVGQRLLELEVDRQTAHLQATLEGTPRQVVIDPDNHVLKTIEVDKPLPLWLAQAAAGPTVVARHRAIRVLADTDSPETVALLESLVREAELRHTLRGAAVDSLRSYQSGEGRAALLELVRSGVDDPRVRAELMRAARDLEPADVVDHLVAVASHDRSYAVREEAIGSLAHHEAKEHADLIADLVHVPSQHEDIRKAALRALAKFDDPRGLDLAIRYAAYGNTDRARAAAVRLVGEQAHHDPDRAVPLLIDLLDDPERRTREAAGRGLVAAGDPRGVAPLERIASSHRDDRFRERARRWAERLKESEEATE